MEQLTKGQKRQQRINKRNELIREQYDKLSSERVGKVRKYSEEAMITLIADKFFLSEKTIEDILYYRNSYKNLNVEVDE